MSATEGLTMLEKLLLVLNDGQWHSTEGKDSGRGLDKKGGISGVSI